jgi:hypothetical protein
MIELAQRGRAAFVNNEKSRARLSASPKRQNAARRGWLASSLPAWLTQSAYREMILPWLAQITVPTLARTMNVKEPYTAEVRKERFAILIFLSWSFCWAQESGGLQPATTNVWGAELSAS